MDTTASDARPVAEAVRPVYDADGYRSSILGVTVDTIRTGVGSGPNFVRATRATSLAATAVKVQFPYLSRATIPEDRIIVAAMLSTPPANSFCGIDLEPGLIVVYGPGVEHTAVNPIGTRFAFAIVELPALQSLAESLKLGLDPPRRGEVAILHPAPETRAFTDRLLRLLQSGKSSVETRRLVESDLLHATVRCLLSNRRRQRLFGRARVDSRRITFDCIDYTEAVGRVPSVVEMCAVSHVSERRLRTAFIDAYGIPPMRFFRMWALAKAHEQLQVADPSPGIVSRVAMDLGLTHLGRFAARYQAIYGHRPSETVRNRQGSTTARAVSA